MSETKGSGKNYSRRNFLKVGGTIAGAAALAPIVAACGDTTPTTGPASTAAATISSATAATGATTAAATGGSLPFAGRTLTIFVYSGPTENAFRQYFTPNFEKATGAKVVLSPGWWDSVGKLKSAPDDQTPFDLVQTDPTQGYPAIRDNLFQKLDLSKIPNAKNFAPAVLDTFVYKEGWGLPNVGPAMTLAWNKELLPDGLKKWSDLFSEGMKGKIMMYNSYYFSLYNFAVIKVEMDGKPGTARTELENNLDGVLQFAKDKRDWVKYWWPTSADAANALVQKNVVAGNIHGSALIAPLQANKSLGFVVPTNDSVYVESFFVVPRQSKNADLAMAAIDFYASNATQRGFVVNTGQQGVNNATLGVELAPQYPVWAKIYPSQPTDFNNLAYYPYDFYDKNADKIQKAWDRDILRKNG